jgi:hypothetical protein
MGQIDEFTDKMTDSKNLFSHVNELKAGMMFIDFIRRAD